MPDFPPSFDIAAARERDVTDNLEKEMRIRERMRLAKLAGMSSDIVERGQFLVAAGLVKSFHYEHMRCWKVSEYKKGIFGRRQRDEEEQSSERVYMEGYDQ